MLTETPLEAVLIIETLENDVDMVFKKPINNLRDAFTNAQANALQQQSIDLLTQNNIELKSTLGAIATQLMWTPYAAFYGETNAGKSTLIEALRLYFGEKTSDAGISIGDGRSDFTREATYYPCMFRNRAFTLVDVPGIEGKESAVENAIRSALARSQAVFYITPDARPPQGGEDGREGTLEKMARQLKPQAKVWAIWNKKIQSPRALKKPLLLENSDEWRSIYKGANSLDAKMREVLGARYQTCLPVSARPAFLALATQLDPESKQAGERAHFLECVPEVRLLEICGIDNVVDLIISAMPDKNDIFQSNLRKLTLPIQECANAIAERSRTNFLTPSHELEAAVKKLKSRLENIAEDTRRNLKRLGDEVIRTIIAAVRSQMMIAIHVGIGNDKKLKSEIESVLEKEKLDLNENIKIAIEETFVDTRKSIDDSLDIMKFDLAQKDTFSIPGFTANFDHTIEVNTKNGVDWIGLGAAVTAGAAALIFTGGWVLVLGVFGALMGAWNAVASLFNFNYKTNQQKKALNNKLYIIQKELSLSIQGKMDEIADDFAKVVHSQATPFERLSMDYHEAGQTLLDVSRKLSALSKCAALMSNT